MHRTIVNQIAIVLFILAGIFLGLEQMNACRPRSVNAPETQFSAGRAMKHIETIALEHHPTGSEANDRVHDYIWQYLLDMGLQPQAFDVNSARSNGVIYTRNIWVRIKGTQPSKSLLLMSHYDSVPSSSGASDDGVGVASLLESLRALTQLEPLKNDLIFIFTDAEELGLLGARTIKRASLFNDEIGLILNFDCRGTTGPVILSQTSRNSGRLISEYARFAPRPVTASWAVEVTRRLPNATDIRLFINEFPALDFAFIDGHCHYHRPTDNIDHVDLASMQQMGETVLRGALHFGNMDLKDLESADRTYYNMMGRLLHFSSSLNLPVSIILTLFFIVLLILSARKEKICPLKVIVGSIAFLIMVGLSGAAVYGLYKVLAHFRGEYFNAFDNPYNRNTVLLFFSIVSILISTSIYLPLRKWTGKLPFQFGIWFVWLACGYAATVLAPGFHFMLATPLLFAMIGFLIRARFRPGESRGDWKDLGILAITSLWILIVYTQSIYLMSVSLGLSMNVVVAVFVVLLLSMLLPLIDALTGKRPWCFIAGVGCLTVIMFALSIGTAKFDDNHPQPYALNYMQDCREQSAMLYTYSKIGNAWFNEILPDTTSNFPQLGLHNVFATTLPKAPLAEPQWVLDSDNTEKGLRTIRGRIFGAQRLLFMTLDSADVHSFKMAGYKYRGPQDYVSMFHCGPRQDGVAVEIQLSPIDNFGFSLIGWKYGLPESVMEILPPAPSKLMPYRVYSRIMKRVSM
ncbi:M28 family peptidase [bacterium]|nr:M28 family peptidase [bacterium]